jgi:hypothetical protein
VSLFSVLTSYVATQFMARRRASGPSESELLRRALAEQIDGLRGQVADENAALRAEVVQLRALLAQLVEAQPRDNRRQP